MTAPRLPVVAGITAGAGASTVATALHGIDGGVARTASCADVLVVRADTASAQRLARLLECPVPARTARPVVAVVADPPAPTSSTCAIPATLSRAAVHTSQVVALPPVRALREGTLPGPQLAMLLAREPERLPAALRAFADALRELAAALVAGGRLVQLAPAPALWPGLGPVQRRRPGGHGGHGVAGLDDEAIEAGHLWRAAG